MIPTEIADKLVAACTQPDFPDLIEQLHSQLTMEVLEAVCDLIYDEVHRNAHRALQWVDILEAIATVINTPHAYARVTWMKGNAFLQLNRYQEALSCFRQNELFYHQQQESLNVVAMQINQVSALRELGEYEPALILAQQAQDTCINLGEPADNYLSILDMAVGWIYEEMGAPQKALAVYNRGRGLSLKLGKREQAALIDICCAYLMRSLDRFQEARKLLIEARTILAKAGYEQHIARIDFNLGELAYKQGQYELALKYYEEAHAGFSQIPLPVEMAVVDLGRSFVYYRLNLISEMMTVVTKAESVFRQNKMIREHVLCLINQAKGYQQLHSPEQADKLLRRARRQLYQQQAWWKLWQVDAHRAQLALEMGRVDTARRIARRTKNQVDPVQHPSLAAQLHLLLAQCALACHPIKQTEATICIQQALALAYTYHLSEINIEAHYLWGTLHTYSDATYPAWQAMQQAIQVSEQLRTYLSQDELQIGFMADKVPVYQVYVDLTHTLVQKKQITPAHLLHSLNLAHTAPLPHHTSHPIDPTLPPDKQTQLTALRQQWRWFQSKLKSFDTASSTAKENTTNRQEMHQKIHDIELEMADLWRRWRVRQANTKTTYSVIPNASPDAFLTSIQQRLHPYEALLQYYVVADQFHAVHITPDNIYTIANLAPLKTLHRLLQIWQFHLRHTASSPQANLKLAQTYLKRLHQALIQPLKGCLKPGTHLYLITPPGWHELPMAALFDGQHYLIEHHTLTYLSNPEAVNQSHQFTTHQANSQEKAQAFVVGYSEKGHLPHTLIEAYQVTQTLAAQWQVHQVLEENATLDAFYAACQQSQLIHLATHAVFRPDNPYFSWIRLANTQLTVADLYNITLPQQPLIVLSACETGRGQARGGGLLGMGRGFLAAGASGLVVTIWRISDSHTAHLMEHFYQTLTHSLGGMNSAIALSYAQRQAIANAQHPFYWAGFIFVGG